MSVVVFVGPSIRPDRIPKMPGVSYVPPIRRGDLSRYEEASVLLILDGEFNQSLSVSPKEILQAMNRGQQVVGASSMGALRASELHSFGMTGVGWVFERFARCSVRRDDDVALTYDPFTMAPVTVPMVNVIYWMEGATGCGSVSSRESRMVISRARKIFFANRSEKQLIAVMEDILGAERVRVLLDETGRVVPDVKELDALEAIQLSSSRDASCC
jgi:hypothetical protein